MHAQTQAQSQAGMHAHTRAQGPEFLAALLSAWREHVLVMQMIRDVLLYVVRACHL
jgi:hypothetical protein